MQINHEYHFKTAEELYDYVITQGKHSGAIYDASEKYVDSEIDKFYDMIVELNKTIDDVNQKIVPTYPYTTHEIDGCLGVVSSEVSVNTVENSRYMLFLGSGPKWSILERQ